MQDPLVVVVAMLAGNFFCFILGFAAGLDRKLKFKDDETDEQWRDD